MDTVHGDLTLEIVNITKTTVESVLRGEGYQPEKVPGWAKQIVERCLEMLLVETKPCKYIVNAMIMPNNGDRPHVASASCWNDDSDGGCTVSWESKAMHCVVSVYTLEP